MTTSPAPDITPRELADRLAGDDPPALIDVREPWEWSRAHIDGARLVPLGELRGMAATIPRDRDVVFYCHHGARSRAAVDYLAAQGVRALNLAGGIDAWSREIDPNVPHY